MENSSKRVLIIPDLYIGRSSGATVTQVLVELLKKQHYQVAVLSAEFKEYVVEDGVHCYPCRGFCGTANIVSKPYRTEFERILNEYKPSYIFFDGSIINKPLCYLEEGLRRGIHIDVFIFMQDFFCAKLYANDFEKPCTKCLTSLLYAFTCPLIAKNKDYVKLPLKQYERKRLSKLLSRVDHVITSTDEQIEFYVRFGVPREKCYKMPLPFIMKTQIPNDNNRGNYLVGIAQNRVEKGFQFVPDILRQTKKTKLVLAYYNDEAVSKAMASNGIKKLVDEGKLEVIASTWSTGLDSLIAGSCGVIIPSIWPTTTEYGLLEALAFSKPVVAFNISIHQECMKEGVHGFFANICDLKSFAQKMDMLSTCSEEEYMFMRQNIKDLYHDMTDWGIMGNHIKKILD